MKKGGSPFDAGWRKKENERKVGFKPFLLIGAICALLVAGWFAWRTYGETSSDSKTIPEKKQSPPAEKVAAGKQHEKVRRGTIFDRTHHELAVSFHVNSIYVRPLEFQDIEQTVVLLAQALGLDEKSVVNEVKTQRSYKWLAKYIAPEKARQVESLHLPGVYFYEQEQRYYPNRQETGHLIGEVKDGRGLSGIELFYDGLLQGSDSGSGDEKRRMAGKDLVLCLDMRLQLALQEEMGALLGELDGEELPAGKSAAIDTVLMDIETGEVLGWSRLPSYLEVDEEGEGSWRESLLAGRVESGVLSLLLQAGAAFEEKVVFDGSEEEKGVKRLVPRAVKIAQGAPAKPDWILLADGSLTSQWLADAFDEQAQAVLADFRDYFDTDDGCSLDMPASSSSKESGLALLCRFASLLNGGTSVAPHVMRATLAKDGSEEQLMEGASEQRLISEEASRDLQHFLRSIMPRGSSMLYAERFGPLRRDKDSSVLPSGEKRAASDMDADQETPEKKDKPRWNGVVLAAAPAAAPKLIMLSLVHDAGLALDRPSPFPPHMRALLERAMRLYDQGDGRKAPVARTSREELFHQWLRQGGTIDPINRENIERVKGVMPDLRGMSLRRALQELEPMQVKIVVEGSGVVTRQHPPRGGAARAGSVVVLQAAPEQARLRENK